MKTKNQIRRALTATLLVSAMGWGAVVHAIPVSGVFTLLGDSLGQGVDEVIATGEFTTSSDPADVTVGGYTDADGNMFSTITLDVFNVFDQDGRFGDFILGGPDVLEIVPVVAILDGVEPDDRVIGFEGTLFNGLFPSGSSLILNGPNDVESPGQPAQFGAGNFLLQAEVSGIQVVPEPGALALLGAGFVAFGAARRRRVRTSS